MKPKEKINPAEYPADSNREISGLEEAIRNTQNSITNDRHDKSELNSHLEGLRRQLVKARENQRTKGKK
ncbi:MAG: hypothetical protein Q7S43_00565 [bacterium]|nr:hypothetical protein [bacterium]